MFWPLVCSAILATMLTASLAAQHPAGHAAAQKKGGAAPSAPNNKKANRNIVDKWNRMPPAERDKALAKLPPGQRDKIQQQLNRYNNLTPQQRGQLQKFNQLAPEKQNQLRRLFSQYNEFPKERQGMLIQEYENLRAMPEADRKTRLNSDEFRGKYDAREQKFLGGLSDLLSPTKQSHSTPP